MDIAGDKSTTARIGVGDSVIGTLETIGDRDWYRIDLDAGQAITVFVDGITLEDSYVRIRDANGIILYENDDISLGVNRDSLLSFTAEYSGTYYIDVGSWDDSYTGDYSLQVSTYTPPPVWTNDEVAEQLTSGYWAGDTHRFNVDQGGSITVNITALSADGQYLARQALGLWSDIIGIDFVEVTSGGQITFDDNEEGAFSDGTWANGFITSTHVNVSAQWLLDYGTEINSYAFQTYLHEIGHALGLGHAGNYNSTARYPYESLFSNDAWPVTVMSYFNQIENDYFNRQGFTELFVGTPMVADIVAMAELYGLSTTTRTGNTTYGFNSNAGRDVFDADLHPDIAYTVFDSGGNDTLDYSQFGADQRINLNPETFSDVGGNVGNVSIARGVVIENAIGGSGDDLLIGNGANNRLTGGAGIDTASYAAASAGIAASLATSASQNTGGAGTDTLSGIENLTGSAFDDQLIGESNANVLFGAEGDDFLVGGLGDDTIDGGVGTDTASFADAASGVTVNLGTTARQNTGTGSDVFRSIENLVGSAFGDTLTGAAAGGRIDGRAGADVLRGGTGADELLGGTGDDSLYGRGGNDELRGGDGLDRMYGGTGDDRYLVTDDGDTVSEVAGEGIDMVFASVTHVLTADVENLSLEGSGEIRGYGNALDNLITGNSGANRLYGRDGDDRLLGYGGSDRLYGDAGLDRLYGGTGDDIYIVNDSSDYAYELAGEGDDRAYSTISYVLRDNVERLYLEGTNAINGYGASDANLIFGNSAANKLNGWGGDDKLYGALGNDRLYGTEGDDRLFGEDGNDRLDGGAGFDRLYGGQGDDLYIVRDATDYAYEGTGEGNDTTYSFVTYVLRSNVETLRLSGSADINGFGSSGADTLVGNSAENRLNGRDGDDRLFGGSGNDRLYGEDGSDRLDGGRGIDLLFGGAGSDIFLFRNGDIVGATFATADRIVDFSKAEGDRLHLDVVDADTGTAGNQDFAFLGTAAFTGTAGELRYEQVDGSTMVQADVDGDGIADFAIRIDGLHTLSSDDFIL